MGDKWDDNQEWLFGDWQQLKDLGYIQRVEVDGIDEDGNPIKDRVYKVTGGWEVLGSGNQRLFRKRIK